MKSNNFTYLDCASLWPSYILSVRDLIQTILDLKLNREALENPQKKTNMTEGKRACALDCWPNSSPSGTIDFRSIHFLVRSTSLEVRLICVMYVPLPDVRSISIMYDPLTWCTIHFPYVRFICLEVRSISYTYDSFPSRYDPLTLRYDRFPLRYDPFPNFVPNPPPYHSPFWRGKKTISCRFYFVYTSKFTSQG